MEKSKAKAKEEAERKASIIKFNEEQEKKSFSGFAEKRSK